MIGIIIKHLRTQFNISQAKLAQETGISQSAIAKWEMNKTEATESNIVTLAKYFDVSTDYLLGLEEYQGLLNDKSVNKDTTK